jgi:hypothetical protein
MAIRADPLPVATAVPIVSSTVAGVRRAALWGLFAAKLIAGWGVQWDIQWHVLIGRDSFWIAPHIMTYAGVGLVVLLSWGVVAWESLLAARYPARATDGTAIRLLGLTATRGFHLAAWGIALTVLAAPIDDLWHRLFGLDVTIWSPPHLLGILGAAVNTVGCLLIATEVFAAERGRRLLALSLFGAMLYGALHLVVDPSNLLAYRYGGVFFYTLAFLSAVLLPVALVTTARVSNTRWAPVLVVLVIIPMGIAGGKIAQVGFALLQPVSVIQEEIAKDPESPIAVAYAIARKNGTMPGRTGGTFHLFALLPVAAMAALDPRRRPVLATMAYAATMFLVLGRLLSARPAFAPLAPGVAETAVAFALVLAAAAVGATVARWLSDSLARPATANLSRP